MIFSFTSNLSEILNPTTPRIARLFGGFIPDQLSSLVITYGRYTTRDSVPNCLKDESTPNVSLVPFPVPPYCVFIRLLGFLVSKSGHGASFSCSTTLLFVVSPLQTKFIPPGPSGVTP